MKPGLSRALPGIRLESLVAVVLSLLVTAHLPSFSQSASPAASVGPQASEQALPASDQEPLNESSLAQNPAPGTVPVVGDVPPTSQAAAVAQKGTKESYEKKSEDAEVPTNLQSNPRKLIDVGGNKITVKPVVSTM